MTHSFVSSRDGLLQEQVIMIKASSKKPKFKEDFKKIILNIVLTAYKTCLVLLSSSRIESLILALLMITKVVVN
jgi:hypothetical protein